MAICTICGSRFTEQDMKKHICEEANKPQLSKEIKADGTIKDI